MDILIHFLLVENQLKKDRARLFGEKLAYAWYDSTNNNRSGLHKTH